MHKNFGFPCLFFVWRNEKMIHPSTELRFINNEIGYGVVATELIPKGTITWVLDKLDREFTSFEIMAFDQPYQEILSRYCYRNNAGKFVLAWDNGRYVNHSFRSNCMSTAYDFEIAIKCGNIFHSRKARQKRI